MVRSGPSGPSIAAIRQAIESANSTLTAGHAQSMDELISTSVARPRFQAVLVASFAVLGLTLAVIGIYGVMAYSISQRTREIGVRMALGAQTMDILRLVVNQGMRPVVFGLVVGVGAALALGRLIASQLYETSAHNPLLLSATIAVLGIAALLACLFPARRASLLNPVEALRVE